MKKRMCVLLVFVVLLAVVFPHNYIQTSAASVKISKTKATMEVDSILTLKVSGTSSKISWSTSNKKVATVTKKGKVTAKAEGTATITAKVGSSKYNCDITVVDNNKKDGNAINLTLPEFPALVYRGSGDYLYCEDTINSITYSNDDKYLYLKVKQSRTDDNDWGNSGGYIVIYNDDYEELAKIKVEAGNIGKTVTKEYQIKLDKKLKVGGNYILDFEDDGYVRKNKDSDTDKKKDIVINLPNTPTLISNYGSDDRLKCQFKVTGISYEASSTSVTIYFTVEKTYDKRGDGQSDTCMIGWKLYDSEGYIIDSGTTYSDSLKVGDKQKKVDESIYGLEKNETYTLEIMDVN